MGLPATSGVPVRPCRLCGHAGGLQRGAGRPGPPPNARPPARPAPSAHRLVAVLLLLQLLHEDGLLLVLAALVLEPDADDARAEPRHLHQLLLHQGVGARVGGVAGPQRVQLLLVQHRPHAGRLLRRLVRRRPRGRRPPGHRLCGGRGERAPSAPPPPLPAAPPRCPPPPSPSRGGPPGAGTCEVRGRRQRGAARPAGGGGAVGGRPVVGAAEQVALPQAELVPGQQLAAAGGAAEALEVVDVVAGAHHQVAAAEGRPALRALDAEEPAGRRRQGARGWGGREGSRGAFLGSVSLRHAGHLL